MITKMNHMDKTLKNRAAWILLACVLGSGTAAFPAYAEEDAFTSALPESGQNGEEEERKKTASKKEVSGEEIVEFACQYIGNPYVWGGTSLEYGADCSGFVLSVFANFGIELPHFAASQAGYGEEVSFEELKPGDLIFYGYGDISHVAIYKGNNEIVHAENEEFGICVTPADFEPVVCCRRLI